MNYPFIQNSKSCEYMISRKWLLSKITKKNERSKYCVTTKSEILDGVHFLKSSLKLFFLICNSFFLVKKWTLNIQITKNILLVGKMQHVSNINEKKLISCMQHCIVIYVIYLVWYIGYRIIDTLHSIYISSSI